jgi:hypothetical protein
MVGVAQNSNFAAIMEQLYEHVAPVLQGNQQVLNLGIRCYSGRHRSVAMANLLQAVLLETGRVRCTVQHHTLEPCGCPTECSNRPDQLQIMRWQADGLLAMSLARHAWALASLRG